MPQRISAGQSALVRHASRQRLETQMPVAQSAPVEQLIAQPVLRQVPLEHCGHQPNAQRLGSHESRRDSVPEAQTVRRCALPPVVTSADA